MNTAEWPHNTSFNEYKPRRGVPPRRPIAHVFTNRIGGSLTTAPFQDHVSHTKFDYCSDAASKRNLFIGVENVQPRIGLPAIPARGRRANDLEAPDPGFTAAQYERLALIYIAASVRRGTWLIPAYHAVIDTQFADGHDDPQRFDATAFAAAIDRLVARIGSGAQR